MTSTPQKVPSIAFFDSGQGGLTVWEPVVQKNSKLNTCYLGDNARTPYGNKSAEVVTRFTSEAVLYLAAQGARMIVVACGTASSAAVQNLQSIYRIPIIGIVEGFCFEASQLLKNESEIVAVLGTRFTVSSGRFEQELKKHGVQNIWQRACPLFVPLVEEGVAPGPLAEAAAEMYLADLPHNVRVVMLACTHFPRMASSIGALIHAKTGRPVVLKNAHGDLQLHGGNLEQTIYLLESSTSILSQVETFLDNQPDKSEFFTDNTRFFCTDAPNRFHAVGRFFTTLTLPNVELVTL